MKKQLIFGRRAVTELLESGLEVMDIFLLASGKGEVFQKLRISALKKNIPIVTSSRAELDRIVPNGNHQGVVAQYIQPRLLTIDELLEQVLLDGNNRPLLLLDGIEDPRNLGAIIRSAEVLGAGGVVFKKHRAVGVTPFVVRASAGAALWFPLAEVANLPNAMQLMKDNGYWIYGLDADCEECLWELKLNGLIAFIIGGEGKGLTRLVKERCDKLVHIPQVGKVSSLNASISASIALAEWLRQNTIKF